MSSRIFENFPSRTQWDISCIMQTAKKEPIRHPFRPMTGILCWIGVIGHLLDDAPIAPQIDGRRTNQNREFLS